MAKKNLPSKKQSKGNPISWLEAIAATAPKEEEKPASPTIRQGKNVDPGASQSLDLGPLDVEKYLSHYGIEFQRNEKGSKTLYTLNQCLFNPNHGKKESAIVQDQRGLLTYWCFHDTCNHTWHEARSAISGTDRLAQFCDGYDPNFKPARKTSPMDS